MRDWLHKTFRPLALALLLMLALTGAVAAQPYAPTTGTINNLVVFIRFSDQPEFTRPLAYYDNLFNSASNSLKNFYLENSYNSLTVSSTFYPTSSGTVVSYQDAHPAAYYRPYDAATNPLGYQGAESTARETALVTNALNAAQIPAGLNLDGNNDGYIDHIAFEVYSSDLNPLPVLFYSRATYDWSGGIVINGKHVGNYTWNSATQDSPPSYPGATEIHEMGHSFGYPDLRANNGRTPVGDWDIMSLSRPVHSGAYMKNRFTHWIPGIPEITSYGTYTINDITQATNNSYKIAIPNSNEFLVLEYRKAAGPFESNLPGSGLCISRVNEAAGIWGNLNGNPASYFLYYYRANGSMSNDGTGNAWEACLNAESGRTQFNDHSNPACFLSNGNACGISIYGVGSMSGSSMTFSVGDPNAATVTRAISGYLSNGGSRVSGATVTLSGDASSVATTGSLGTYAFSVPEHGNYTITPAKANLTFSPLSKSYSNLSADQTQNFSSTNNTNTISGTITSTGVPMSGVTVYCTGGNYPSPITTDATGTYSFTVYAGSDYQVWPAKTGSFFSPNSKSLANVTTNLVQDFNTIASSSTTLASALNPSNSGESVTFTATVNGYAPSGSVSFNDSGIAICSAVTVSNGQARCATSSLSTGSHSISAVYSGDGSNYGSSSATLTQSVRAATTTTTTIPATTTTATTTTTTPTTTTSTATTSTAPVTTTTTASTTSTAAVTTTTIPTTTTTSTVRVTTTTTPITTTTTSATTTSTASTTTTTIVATGGSVTLSGTRNVTAETGSAVIIPTGTAAAGSLITLRTPAAVGVAQAPVAVTIGGQSVNVSGNSHDAVVKVNTAVINGVPTPVLQTTSGTASMSATATSQPMLAVGNAVVISESPSAAATSSLNATTGTTQVTVTGGQVSLSAATLAGGKVYAGETALISSAGVVSSVTVGSANGTGSVGDPLVVANRPDNLDLGDVAIPSLKGTVTRIGGGTQNLEQAILSAVPGISLASGGQTTSGILPVITGNVRAYLQPVGAVTIDAAKPDGTTINDEGMIQLAQGGVVVTFAPSVPDTRQFAVDLGSAAVGASARLAANGKLVATLGNTQIVLQPGLAVTPGATPGSAGFEQDGKGYIVYRDSAGNRQTLYPTFLDTKALNQVIRLNFGADASAVPDFAGSVSVKLGAAPAVTLTPDYALTGVPAAQQGKAWWADPGAGKFFIVNSDGTAQGFTPK